MTVTVPSKDTVHFAMQSDITTLTNVISANGGNGKQAFELTKLKAQKQRDLVLSLVASGNISAANVLTNETYVTAQPGGDAF